MGRKRRAQQSSQPFVQWTKENPAHEEYYRLQLGLEASELAAFLGKLREQLPVVFRLNPSEPRFRHVLSDPTRMPVLAGEVRLAPVAWYPDELAWQVQTTRSVLKREESSKALHSFITQASDAGLVTRQELVSMLPVLALDVQPGHNVVDLCAAPGSKSVQCAEQLQGRGLLLANDADPERAHMLIHQLHRVSAAQVAITNHQAQFFPSLGSFLFDRVLCDVPCTGDGAMRKIPTKWKTWTERDAFGVHPLQLDILTRALALCKPGGLVVYSTCSLNPIENEAVVAAALKRRRAELVDLEGLFAARCPGLRVRQGLPVWKVLMRDKSATTPTEFFEVQPGQKVNGFAPKLTCFPDGECEALRRTVRIMPHDQDTGGFYIALFRVLEQEDTHVPEEKAARKGPERFVRLTAESPEYQELRECYGLSADLSPRQLLSVSESLKSKVFYVNRELADFLDQYLDSRLAFLSLGVRAFGKNREKGSKELCSFRLCQEALPFLSSFVTSRRVESSDQGLLQTLLRDRTIDLETRVDLASQLQERGYFVMRFTCCTPAVELVLLRHPNGRVSSMASDEDSAGLILLIGL